MNTPVRILVCPQEFKGSLDAGAAAAAIATGIRRVLPEAEIVQQRIADGGPGTLEAITASVGAAFVATSVSTVVPDAYGRPVTAAYALLDIQDGNGSTAIVESAAAVALARTDPADRTPLRSTSNGVGMLIRDAVERGARSIIVGVGGTASADGGVGAARALGIELHDAAGQALPDEAIHLRRLATITDRVPSSMHRVRVRIAVDVTNPLTGPEGATAIFGAQKGLLGWQGPALDSAIRHWAMAVRTQLGREIEAIDGAGAGGGIPAGILAALPDVSIESGAALVAEFVELRRKIAAADLVVTGEGSLDDQTAFGKAVAHIATLAGEERVPCLAVAGTIEALPHGIADAEPLARSASEIEAAIQHAAEATADAAERLIRRWRTS